MQQLKGPGAVVPVRNRASYQRLDFRRLCPTEIRVSSAESIGDVGYYTVCVCSASASARAKIPCTRTKRHFVTTSIIVKILRFGALSGDQWVAKKRYSEFHQLHASLTSIAHDCNPIGWKQDVQPHEERCPFPSKSYWPFAMSAETLEARRSALDAWIVGIATLIAAPASPV